MKKKLLSLLLALVMVLGLTANVSAAANGEITSGDWTYKTTADGVVLTEYVGTATEVVAPGKIDGLDVWALGPGIGCAFTNVKETMTSLTLEEGIDYIQTNAVKGCTALETVYIADTVTSIGTSAFQDCSSLSDVYLGEGVKNIGSYAFLNTDLVALYLPASVNYIYDYAFGYSGEWGDVEKDESFGIFGWAGTYARQYASKWHFTFYYLDDMTEISGRCGENATWRFEESTGTLYIEGEDDTAPYYNSIQPWIAYAEDITRVVIGEGIDHLGDYSFANYYPNLTEVVIPDSLSSLGNAAFLNCTGLTKIEITTELSYFGGSTFRNTGLKEVVFPAEAGYAPNIGGMCFADCKNLTYVKLPSEMDWSGDGLFANCPKLSGVDMSGCSYIGTLGDEMFRNCDSLVNIDFHTATSIQTGMYQECDGLKNVVIPACVTHLYIDAFADCSSLTNVVFTGDAPSFSENVFRNDTLTAWYPANNETWTEYVMQQYGGTITWKSYEPLAFTDVLPFSFYYDPVAWAVDSGVTNGLTETTFGPGEVCNRAQVVTFLWRAAGSPEPTVTEHPFVDVSEDAFYYKAMLWAVENGITTGTDATHFSPNAACNRATVVTFLHRAAGSPAPASSDNPFTDVNTGSWYGNAVLWAVENDITKGLTSTEFGPTANCNRAQVVTFLYRNYVN